MKALVVSALLSLTALPTAAYAAAEGWGYLIAKLVADGVKRERVMAVFNDDRVPAFTPVEFSPDRPRERRELYAGFRKPRSMAAARRCRTEHAADLEAAAKQFGVSADVLGAILFIESRCGVHSGSNVIFLRLARLAMANEPYNLRHNLDRYSEPEGGLDPEVEQKLRGRARYLEQTFYPEVKAMFAVAERMRLDPLELRGSGSGAFGYPQFLPTSYLAFGVDADADGRVDLYDVDDAAASCGRYLSAKGWHPKASSKQKRAAIWSYNHSEAYIDAVLHMATTLGKPAPPAKAVAKRKPKNKTARLAARRKR